MSKIGVGDKVPEFSLPSACGTNWKRSDARGEKLVLYFYPKDMTTGCTLESQQFRDLAGGAAFIRLDFANGHH